MTRPNRSKPPRRATAPLTPPEASSKRALPPWLVEELLSLGPTLRHTLARRWVFDPGAVDDVVGDVAVAFLEAVIDPAPTVAQELASIDHPTPEDIERLHRLVRIMAWRRMTSALRRHYLQRVAATPDDSPQADPEARYVALEFLRRVADELDALPLDDQALLQHELWDDKTPLQDGDRVRLHRLRNKIAQRVHGPIERTKR